MDNFFTILTIVAGNGVVIAALTLAFNFLTERSGRKIKAREQARDFYMNLYGKIAYVQLLQNAYSAFDIPQKPKTVNVFTKARGRYANLDRVEVEANLSEIFSDFSNYYATKRFEGYDIFLPTKLQELVSRFWEDVAFGKADREQTSEVMTKIGEKCKKCLA
jgi:hypothetical protein